VKFVTKSVSNNFGDTVEGVFADFSWYSIFNLELPVHLYQASDLVQFNYCLNELRTYYLNNSKKTELKLDRQHYLLIDNKINTFKGDF
jgi:hypothetical protein